MTSRSPANDPQQIPGTLLCARCGTLASLGTRFCPCCGSALAGAEIPEGSRGAIYCTLCGGRLEEHASPERDRAGGDA